MKLKMRAAAAATALVIAISAGGTASAKKRGGILKTYDPDSPASMSILEEGTVFAEGPMMMGVFNNVANPHRPPLRDQRRAGVHVGRNPWGSGAFP
jgi:hypothetical protein